MEPPHILMLVVTAIAAFTDTRQGLIPNWLTLPAIAAGPLYALVFVSSDQALRSLLAVVLVGLVPYIMYRMDSMGGGDVKLFAAIGGLAGIVMGLEVMVYSMVVAMVIAIFTMAYRGELFALARNIGRILINPFLPKSHRKKAERSEMHTLRLGPSIFAGAGVALGYSYGLV